MTKLPFALVIVLFLCPVLPSGAIGQDHLTREELQLPTNGSTVRTTTPLEAYRVYRVVVSSPYDLSAIQRSVVFDGETLPLDEYATGLYGVVNYLYFLVQGKGHPLQICIADGVRMTELQKKTPSITVEVFRYHWWQSHHGYGPHHNLIKAALLAAGFAVFIVYFRYFSPVPFRQLMTHINLAFVREGVMPIRPTEPAVRVVRRPPARRPETPNPTRITHRGENRENDRH